MDRRRALGAAIALPALLASARAAACSIAVESPETYAARIPEVAKLFQAWFGRDELVFLGELVGPRKTEGTPSEETIRRYIEIAEDREPQRLFETMFTDEASHKQLLGITAVGDKAFVAVSEQDPGGIGADCSNMPVLHLFLLTYRMGRPSAIRHLESETWSGYGQTSSWSS